MAKWTDVLCVICCLIMCIKAWTYKSCHKYNTSIIKCPELLLGNGFVCYTWRWSLGLSRLSIHASFVCHHSFRLRGNIKLKCKYNHSLSVGRYGWYWDKGKPNCTGTGGLQRPVVSTNGTKLLLTIAPSLSSNSSVRLKSVSLLDIPMSADISPKTSTESLFNLTAPSSPASPQRSRQSEDGDHIFLLPISLSATVAILLTICILSFLIYRYHRGHLKAYEALFSSDSDSEDEYLYNITSVTNPFYLGYLPRNERDPTEN